MTKNIFLALVASAFAFSALACNGSHSKSTEGQTTTQTTATPTQSVKK